jgi:ABC-type sugar transport system ATPase subunit
MSVPLLRAEKVSLRFGGLQALDQVSFDLHEGEVHSLVGHNGAGKTTFIRVLSGVYQPQEGRIFLRTGQELREEGLHALARAALAYRLFLARLHVGHEPPKVHRAVHPRNHANSTPGTTAT